MTSRPVNSSPGGYGGEEIVRKIGIDPKRDNPSRLMSECIVSATPGLVQMLIDAGADPNCGEGERHPMHALIHNFQRSIESEWGSRSPDSALKCIEIAARAGGRWRPTDLAHRRWFRTALGRTSFRSAIGWLTRLVDCGAIEQPFSAEIMRTPKMKSLLMTAAPGAVRLRELAEIKPRLSRASRALR